MDLRQLRYFLAVAEERSVTRAATRLHLTQPPLSAQLARLEHELGVALFVRHRRGVDLTEAGRHLVDHARRVLSDVDAAEESVRRTGQGRSGRLALAFVPETVWSVLPPLLRRFHAARPEVELRFLEGDTDAVAEHVRSRRADLGLVHLPPGGAASGVGPDLDVAVARREPMVAVVPRTRADALGDRVDLSELTGEPFLCPGRAVWGGLALHLLGACRLSGFEPTLHEVDLAQSAVALVGAGRCLGVAGIRGAGVRPGRGDAAAGPTRPGGGDGPAAPPRRRPQPSGATIPAAGAGHSGTRRTGPTFARTRQQ